MEECWSCLSNEGTRRISPGPTIYEGTYWRVEHAYPAQLLGWLVLVLNRHAEALHELRPEEFAEFATLLERTTKLLREVLDCEKEYVIALAEAEHFHHVHVHVVPRAADLPPEFRGAKVFGLLGEKEGRTALPPAEVKALCEALRAAFAEGREGG
jgi:diadenosine tetraphosphate (Ap4A) HIT family hydrolase